jgi:hypothetical protein
MTNRKLIKMFLTISFVFVFLVESILAGICFCGKCFPTSLQGSNDLQTTSINYKSVPGKGFNKCNFEKLKFIRGIHFSKKASKVNPLSIFINSDPGDRAQIHQSPNSLIPLLEINLLEVSPIYLKNLSIRC